MWAITIYELADPYNATINVCVKGTVPNFGDLDFDIDREWIGYLE